MPETAGTAEVATPVAPAPRLPLPPERPPGPPAIEVEYIFGGAAPDEINPVTTIAVLPPRKLTADATTDDVEAHGATPDGVDRIGLVGKKAFGRAKDVLRKR